ncbi:hypothetical protein OE88DRAFT_1736788 [Heliocybe sulcata]|uniref:F-box domain-containing protein n=1 Tax=Heliocybe sulcata TaxID=5364 RepID=A0A5C3MY48_9AGAM|nr:hypothetical protein OE88DRAFT_1736788 [Heliocybe sulcata]
MPGLNDLFFELLQEVFLYYVADCRRNQYEWVRLIVVCKRWKEILESPIFWKDVAVEYRWTGRALPVALRNSHGALLSISGSMYGPDNIYGREYPDLVLMQRNQHRIRGLNLEISRKFLRMWTTPITKLRELSLTMRFAGPNWYNEAALLSHFDSPELQKLELSYFPWAAVRPALKGGLGELTLVNNHREELHTEELLAALEEMPHLRRLRIEGWHKTSVAKEVQPVTVPRLESLAGSCVCCTTFLSFIAAPALRHM